MAKKRILIFSLAYYPKHVGGAEVAIKEITDRISGEEADFHLITNRFDTTLPREERIGNVTLHRVGFGRRGAGTAATHSKLFYLAKVLFVPAAVWRARALHKAEPFAGAWAMMAYMVFPLALLRLVGTRIPYALTLQEGDPFEHVFERWYIRAVRPLLAYGFRHAAVVQCISTFLAAWARQTGTTAPIVVIPNGVNVRAFSQRPSEEELDATRQVLGKLPGDTWLIHTGRFVHKNGLDTVIRAVSLLPESVHLLLVGEGPLEAALRGLAKELGLESRVHFQPYVPLADIVRYLHACDIFVRPSRSEGMGISFVEAMAAGLPIIATQEGGISDFLFDTRRNPNKPTTGWAVDVGSHKQIAKAVQDILAHPEDVRKVTETARSMVSEKYDWDHIAEEMRTKVLCA